MAQINYYNVLGISQTATDAEIKAARNGLAKEHAPDIVQSRGGSKAQIDAATRQLQQINEAFDTLKDPKKRAGHNHDLRYSTNSSVGAGSTTGGYSSRQQASPFDDIFDDLFGQRRSQPGSEQTNRASGNGSTEDFQRAADSATSRGSSNTQTNDFNASKATVESILRAVQGNYAHHRASNIAAIYAQRPELIVSTGGQVLTAMDGKGDHANVAKLINTIVSQIKAGKASLSPDAVKGLSDTDILVKLAALPNLVQDAHILRAVQSNYAHHRASNIAAIYVQRPELIVSTGGQVLTAMDGKGDHASVAKLINTIVSQIKAGKASLSPDAVKGLSDTDILVKLAALPNLVQDAHILRAVQSNYAHHRATNITAIYAQRPELIVSTGGQVLTAMDGKGDHASVAKLINTIVSQIKAGKASLSPDAVKGLSDTDILVKLAALPNLVQDAHILRAVQSNYAHHRASNITAIYAQRPELIVSTGGQVLTAMNGKGDHASVAKLVNTIVGQIKAGKASLTTGSIKGLTDQDILSRLHQAPLTPGNSVSVRDRESACGD